MKTDRIASTFSKCRAEGRAAFVAYLTAGDPDAARFPAVVDAVVNAGADILELGMPFSDPLADGEANQLSAQRALDSGATPETVLELAAGVRKSHPDLPLVLFTYMNPVAYSGNFSEFCRKAVSAGFDAILPLDLPPEESPEFRTEFDATGLGVVSLIAPTTKPERIGLLCRHANSFIYYICQEGVTGERREFASGVREKVSRIRAEAELPIVVGFGISKPEHVRAAIESGPDGIVVGSAIVRKIEALAAGRGSVEEIGDFVRSLTDNMGIKRD
jgi:tryptophan synthase alpha chain